MTILIALIFIVMIFTNAWMERRISTLEKRWDDYIGQQQSFQELRR
jgi:hypothetical protein